MTARAAAVKKRVVIEQAIARGETVIAMCRRLRVSEDDVVEVWMRMEKLCTEPNEQLVKVLRCSTRLLPCGTHAAFNRHKSRGETVCGACERGERIYQSERRPSRARTA